MLAMLKTGGFQMKALLFYLALSSQIVSANTDSKVINAEPINVDGVLVEQTTADPELENIRAEIEKQKQDIVLNKEKAKNYKELSKSVEKLSESTEEYLEEKNAAKEEIAAYNQKVKCLQAENPGPECDKFIRRR